MPERQTQDRWFDVSREGLGQLRESADPASVLYELVQNVWDEDGATRADLRLTPHGRGTYLLDVEDDVPGGFRDLADAYRLFAPSYKREHAEKRGRFNLGEKLVLALCVEAQIVTTSGTVTFNRDGTRTLDPEAKRPIGSHVTATIRFTKAQAEQAVSGFRLAIPPKHVRTTLNGDLLSSRRPERVIPVKALATVLSGPEGWRPTTRDTTIEVYEATPDGEARVYEMGIPIVTTGDRWSVNVLQKVPLNMDRDNVTPAYLRRLRTEVANGMFDRLTADDATATWAKEALADSRVSPEAARAIIVQRFGDKAVAFDPSDIEGSKRAVAEGYTVVYPRMLGGAEWEQVRAKTPDLLRPAGQVTPSNAKVLFAAGGKPPIPPEKWTDGMVRIARFAREAAQVLIERDIRVTFHSEPTEAYAAAYGDGSLTFNLGRLGHAWFTDPDERKVWALVLHELAHDRVHDHLSAEYADECARLGAVAICAQSVPVV